jgi:predicted permease
MLLAKLRALFRRKNLEAEMAEEMRQHLERRTQEKLGEGLTSQEARYAAQREFGGVALLQEQCRDERRFVWLEQMAQDVRYAARQLRRNPGFATVAVLTLSIGIGATTAIFSVVNGVLLKPLPYEEPGELVQVFEVFPVASPGVFMDWREQATQFEGFAAWSGAVMNLTGTGEPQRLSGLRMTSNGFQLLRARPVVGRVFAPEEDQAGQDKVVVLTYRLWQRNFGGERGVVGRTMSLNDESYTIVGVLPDGFLPFATQEFVIPLRFDATARENRRVHPLTVLARLKAGVTREQAQVELNAIGARVRPLLPEYKRNWITTVVSLQEHLSGGMKPTLLVLAGAVGLVFLIAGTNVANLLLAKASVRQREIAVRAALGASRGRIVRQLLTESLLLSALGALVGLLLAFWSMGGVRHLLASRGFARTEEVTLDPVVLGLALTIALLAGIGFGLAPALQSSRPNLIDSLKDATRGGSATAGKRLRSALIIGEVAMALMLLAGAGLLLHSFYRLVNVPPGFSPENTLTAPLSISQRNYPDASRRSALYQRIAESVAALPGVEAAGLAASLPLRGVGDAFFRIAGRVDQPEPGYSADYDFCTADYFRALGIPQLRGRGFTASETAADTRVAVINATFAQELFAGENPIGRHLEQNNESWEIVGVVGDVRMRQLTQRIRPMVYRPQSPTRASSAATLVVRTRASPLALTDGVRRVIREIDPSQPVANVLTLDGVIAASLSQRRLILYLLAAFAVVALLLAAIGLYGVIAYAVTQRQREFGIRVALGAARTDMLRLVLTHGLKLVGVGLALGLAGALGLTHLLANLLYEITPTDPLTLGAVTLVLLAVGLFASWLPARRAARVDPIIALRTE